MKTASQAALALTLCAIALPPLAANGGTSASFSFGGVPYFYRWSNRDAKGHATATQTEFTPGSQTNLDRFGDMITVVKYLKVHDADALHDTAENVVALAKSSRATILVEDGPRPTDTDKQYFLADVIPDPAGAFLEAAFTRFRLHGGSGWAVVYSHRIYGAGAESKMNAWLRANGATVQRRLIAWNLLPEPAH